LTPLDPFGLREARARVWWIVSFSCRFARWAGGPLYLILRSACVSGGGSLCLCNGDAGVEALAGYAAQAHVSGIVEGGSVRGTKK
jgi:hypothetical protein